MSQEYFEAGAPRSAIARHLKALCVLLIVAALMLGAGFVVSHWSPQFWLVLIVAGIIALWYRLALKFVDEVWS